MTTKVSVVDDDQSIRKSMILLLESYGFDARTYASGESFLED